MPLSSEQRRALWTSEGDLALGHRIVSARAGTGKTRLLGEYCNELDRQWPKRFAAWQGAAILSFTNVARGAIESRVKTAPSSLALTAFPHFVGTIDGFLNQHVFLPFGAASMDYDGRPKLVGPPIGTWNPPKSWSDLPSNAYAVKWFDCYSFREDDEWLLISKRGEQGAYRWDETPVKDPRKIKNLKRWVWARGYATQSDANYLALQTLKKSPRLTQALIRRFPVVIIDEAQDMTAVQHAIVDYLSEAGLDNIVIIGDAYQAIYEWNTARPQLFTDKIASELWEETSIADTYRCSPAICSTLTKMIGDGLPIQAAPEAKNSQYDAPVEVHSYVNGEALDQVNTVVDAMAHYLAGRKPHSNSASGPTIAVVSRLTTDVSELYRSMTRQGSDVANLTSPTKPARWKYKHTKQFLRILSHRLEGNLSAAMDAYEALMLDIYDSASRNDLRDTLAAQWGTDEDDVVSYRTRLITDLDLIAETLQDIPDPTIENCLQAASLPMNGIPADRLFQIRKDLESELGALLSQQLARHETASSAAKTIQHHQHPNVTLTFSTIHGVKGETYDGVVFYANELNHGCKCRPSSSKRWGEILNHSLIGCESKRVVYVALSRPAQALSIVSRSQDVRAWRKLSVPNDVQPLQLDLQETGCQQLR